MLKNVAEPPSPSSKSKRRPIDFGASVERDEKVVSTFQRLHQVLPANDRNIKSGNESTNESANKSAYEATIESTIESEYTIESANEPDYKPDNVSANKSAIQSSYKPALESIIKYSK